MKLLSNRSILPIIFFIIVLSSISAQNSLGDKLILGSEEMALFTSLGESFTARIDTGAETSSIHARGVVHFVQNGENWVRFNINHDGTDRFFECPLESMVAVRQANSQTPVYRPVVKLNIQIGELRKDALFTLADRSRMAFPVLIGRNFLKGDALVDVSTAYLHGK
ncbi:MULTISPECIES: RimK/LysX family protein [unclassified Oceanispirochaeta]|uniref:ATP-dependent zinc protease family protein n=1 Tax=unclassified Oceanispirochaeta TaxID=2635722 RepID=UPI0011C03E3F|nr:MULTISPECIES: RimK/LysX family protein [unclassified Oceanispirochaeta]MBF9018856.1 ATP-dependent zinc protease [Oceanispirochaeta sp. M2]NPD75344.1 hypothetical protein [Oceanispirochaeta sp. M1]